MSYKIFSPLLLILLLGCKGNMVPININNHSLMVEIADTQESRAKGLMFREELGQDEGMLFIFDKEQKVSFWMKNTGLPLSVAYIDKSGVIREIYDLKPYSLEPVSSKISSVYYVLEVNRGYFKEKGISIGDKITLGENP